jgi:hypothetical protein
MRAICAVITRDRICVKGAGYDVRHNFKLGPICAVITSDRSCVQRLDYDVRQEFLLGHNILCWGEILGLFWMCAILC